MSDSKNSLEDLNTKAMLSQQGGHGGVHFELNEVFGRKSEDAKKVMGWDVDTSHPGGGSNEGGGGGGDYGGGSSGGGDWAGGHPADHSHEGPIFVAGTGVSDVGSLKPSATPSAGGGGSQERE